MTMETLSPFPGTRLTPFRCQLSSEYSSTFISWPFG